MECREQALRYVERRMRSEWEMRSYLRKKGFAEDEIEETVEFLMHYGYVDDAAYARAFLRDRINLNPCGRNKMYAELRKRGVKSDVIKEALGEEYPAQLELKVGYRLLRKQVRLAEEPRKQAQYLQNKGFSRVVISRLVDFE